MQDEHRTVIARTGGLEVTLGEVLVFSRWMEQAQRAWQVGRAMPSTPLVSNARVRRWMGLVGTLEQRVEESESSRARLESKLQAQETQVARIFTSLYENLGALHATLGLEDKARDARQRAASCIRLFKLRKDEPV